MNVEQLDEVRKDLAEYANGVDVPAWDLAADCEMLLSEVDRRRAQVDAVYTWCDQEMIGNGSTIALNGVLAALAIGDEVRS